MRIRTLNLAANLAAVGLIATSSLLAAPRVQAQQDPSSPCRQISMACRTAGFEKGKGKEGFALGRDCIQPLMQGVAQRTKATKPLPAIDAQVIAACKAQQPTFGQPKAKQPEKADG